MGRTACTEPQCLYMGALYLYLYFSITFLTLRTRKAAPRAAPPHLPPVVSFPPPIYFTHTPSRPLTIVLHTSVGNDKHVRYFNRDKLIRAADTAYRSLKRNTIAGSKWGTSSFIIRTIHWTYYRGTILVYLFLCLHVTCQLLHCSLRGAIYAK